MGLHRVDENTGRTQSANGLRAAAPWHWNCLMWEGYFMRLCLDVWCLSEMLGVHLQRVDTKFPDDSLMGYWYRSYLAKQSSCEYRMLFMVQAELDRIRAPSLRCLLQKHVCAFIIKPPLCSKPQKHGQKGTNGTIGKLSFRVLRIGFQHQKLSCLYSWTFLVTKMPFRN